MLSRQDQPAVSTRLRPGLVAPRHILNGDLKPIRGGGVQFLLRPCLPVKLHPPVISQQILMFVLKKTGRISLAHPTARHMFLIHFLRHSCICK